MVSPSPNQRRSTSTVFAESYSVNGNVQPFAAAGGRQTSFDELLSPRQAPTPEMAIPLSSSSSSSSSTSPSGSSLPATAMMSTRIDIEEDDGASSSARIAGASQNRADSKLVARTPRVSETRFETTVTVGSRRGSEATHLRRRSSTSNLHQTSLLLDDADYARTAKTTPSSTGMERAPSLTTFMNGGGYAAARAIEVNGRAKAKRLEREGRGGRTAGIPIPRRKLYSGLLRLLSVVGLSLGVCLLLKSLLFPGRAPLDDLERDSIRSPWLARLRDQSLIFDSMETVPYPIKTHPRTPSRAEQSTLTLADYLQTRLGSHFSFPAKNIEGALRGSQLWLTTATADSVELAGQHLRAFMHELHTNPHPPPALALSAEDVTNLTSPRPLENSGQWNARRALVTLCRDNGCIDYCRKDPRLFCYGGFVPHRNPRDPLDKAGLNAQNADEIAKLRAILETLETGRRVFWVDPGTYLRRDPVPYMGDLGSYDLQIPESWSTGRTDSGIAVYNPSLRVITLLQKMVDIARLPLARDRNTWASTNLLLDPSGEFRNYEMAAPRHADALDENLFDKSPNENGGTGYGQAEFESSWDGGLDVRVLDRRYFRSSTGKLSRKQFDYDQQHAEDLLYFHCVCCGDPYTNDYIAGALGYHHPSVSYGITNPRDMPKVPLVLKAVELKGNLTQLLRDMSLLLQVAAETGRTFVPPLTATVIDARGKERQMYIWRVFPVPLWSHPVTATIARLPDRVKLPPTKGLDIREPAFVMHAADYLRATLPDATEASRLAAELTETLTLDLGDGELGSLNVLVERMKRPFWSTERIVALENFEAVRSKDTWKVKSDFADVSMCNFEAKPAQAGGKTCEQLCPL